jgi:hypothetical protein
MNDSVLTQLVREIARDYKAQARIEALPDADLTDMGLSTEEVRLVRDGFFDTVLRMGVMPDADTPVNCCGG